MLNTYATGKHLSFLHDILIFDSSPVVYFLGSGYFAVDGILSLETILL